MCMGLLLPRRWPLSYSQWWECEFITEGIIDNGESSPLLPQGTPLGFLVLGCSSVVPLLQRSAHTVLTALWEGAPLCTRGVVPASPLPHQCCPSPKEGGSLARSSGSLSGPGTSGTNQPLPPLQAVVFGTACRIFQRSCAPAQAMLLCLYPSSCAPPIRSDTLLSACPGPGWGSQKSLGAFGVLVLS